jgi:DNA-binding CsgD family transcriptional regulator
METLNSQDTQQLLHAIQELYTLHDLSSFGVKALEIVNQLVPSDIPEFHVTNARSHTVSRAFLPGYPGFTAEMEQVASRYWREHPIVQNMPLTLTGAYKISDFMPARQFHQLEGLYQQFLGLIGCEDQMVMFLPMIDAQSWNEYLQADLSMAGIALNRSQRNFTERDRLLLNLLRQHLFQAYCNAQRYHQVQQRLTQLQQSLTHLGLIILDTSGQIELITPQASQYLYTYFSQTLELNQLPPLLWTWIKHQVTSTQTFDHATPCLPLHIEQDNKQLVIQLVVESLQGRYLLLLEEHTRSLLPSLALLGLSARETEVLFWIMRGEANQAIAKHLGVHPSTIRKHLESIYHKLGVQSRTEAIAQALDKLGVLPFLTSSQSS